MLERDVVGKDVEDRADVALDARVQHRDELWIVVESGDVAGEELAHGMGDLGPLQLESARDLGDDLGHRGAGSTWVRQGSGRAHRFTSSISSCQGSPTQKSQH
ncbi:MAG: hypothetical protein ACXWXF_09625 [Aeromicrobium sp.]